MSNIIKKSTHIVLFVFFSVYFCSCALANSDEATQKKTHKFGDIEKVITPNSLPSQIVNYEGYTLSFNSKMHIPNWVVWELTDMFNQLMVIPNVLALAVLSGIVVKNVKKK